MASDWERGYTSGYDAGVAAMIRAQLAQQTEPSLAAVSSAEIAKTASLKPEARKRRAVSAYQRAFGKNMKALKRAHPRTAHQTLMAKAHRVTRKALGMKRKRR